MNTRCWWLLCWFGCATAAEGGSEPAGEACPGLTVIAGEEITVDAASLTLARAGNEDLLALESGHILVSGDGEGWIRQVVSVAEQGETIVVQTEEASFADSACESELDARFGVGSAGADEHADSVGLSVNVGMVSLGPSINFSPWATITTDFELTGKLGQGAWARAAFQICPSGGLTIGVSASASQSIFKNVYTQKFPPWTFPLPTPVGIPIPVVITPSIGVGVGLVASLNAPISYNAEIGFRGCSRFAAQWDAGASLPRFEATHDFDVQLVRSELVADDLQLLRAFLNMPELKLCLYGSVCVSLTAQFYVEIRGAGLASQKPICAGIRLQPKFTASIPLFSKKGSLSYSKGSAIDLLRKKVGGTGECGPPPMPAPEEMPPDPVPTPG